MLRKNISILFLIALCFFLDKLNAQGIRYKIAVDTPKFSISVDSSTITLFKDVKDKLFWLDILSRDTILVSLLRKQFKFEIQSISILHIDRIANSSQVYEAEIYCGEKKRPIEIRNDSLPIRYVKRRSCYYQIKLTKVKGTSSPVVSSVELDSCGL